MKSSNKKEGEFEFLPEVLKKTLTAENYILINEAWKRIDHPVPNPKLNGPIKIFRQEYFCENFMDILKTEEILMNKRKLPDEAIDYYQTKIKAFYYVMKEKFCD